MGVFLISGYLVNPLKKYCFNSNNIVMKLGPVTKPGKWKKAISKKLDGDVMAANVDIIAHFPIYG